MCFNIKSVYSIKYRRPHAGSQLHSHQFLEQQLCGVWNLDLRDVGSVVAVLALEPLLVQVSLANQTADAADVHAIQIGHVEETLLQESSCAVRDHAIALHLSETQTAVARTTLGRLASQDLGGTTPA
jgi:hypothetical protein